ncbi:MAG: hypothetical protein ACRDKG_11010 [Actinomycetota bacterium]
MASSSVEIARRVATRQTKLLRAADQRELELLRRLASILRLAQEQIRIAIAAMGERSGAAAYLTFNQQIAGVLAGAENSLQLALTRALTNAAADGAALVDETIEAADLIVPVAAASTDGVAELGIAAVPLILEEPIQIATRAARLQALKVSNGQMTVAAALAAVGTKLLGSRVFGRAIERLTGSASAELGGTHSAAAQRRAAQVARGGVELRKRWVAWHRASARRHHLDAEARYRDGIPIGEKFVIGRFQTHGPRMAGLPGLERKHCRCRLAFLPPAREERP